MVTLEAQAPAKINRELRVGPRRPDGFHEIRSRFVSIDLADGIEVEDARDFALACDRRDLPADRSNLAARAAFALAQRHGMDPRAHVRLSKRIPLGAGLGGGSADAAITLLLLSRLWRLAISPQELAHIAASLGSDVPFFLAGGEANVEGRGERVEPRPDGPALDLTLLVPPFSVSTAEVYAAFDRIGRGVPLPESLEIERSKRFFGPNDLEEAVIATHPEMAEYLESSREVSRECSVTGSGSAIVLVGSERESIAALARRHPDAALISCRTIGRQEYRQHVGLPSETPPRA